MHSHAGLPTASRFIAERLPGPMERPQLSIQLRPSLLRMGAPARVALALMLCAAIWALALAVTTQG